MKKVPLRMCCITREKCEKRMLLRVVRTPDGKVIYDNTSKANGRGVYLKKDKDVILKAQKSKVLDKILEIPVPEEVYSALLSEVENA